MARTLESSYNIMSQMSPILDEDHSVVNIRDSYEGYGGGPSTLSYHKLVEIDRIAVELHGPREEKEVEHQYDRKGEPIERGMDNPLCLSTALKLQKEVGKSTIQQKQVLELVQEVDIQSACLQVLASTSCRQQFDSCLTQTAGNQSGGLGVDFSLAGSVSELNGKVREEQEGCGASGTLESVDCDEDGYSQTLEGHCPDELEITQGGADHDSDKFGDAKNKFIVWDKIETGGELQHDLDAQRSTAVKHIKPYASITCQNPATSTGSAGDHLIFQDGNIQNYEHPAQSSEALYDVIETSNWEVQQHVSCVHSEHTAVPHPVDACGLEDRPSSGGSLSQCQESGTTQYAAEPAIDGSESCKSGKSGHEGIRVLGGGLQVERRQKPLHGDAQKFQDSSTIYQNQDKSEQSTKLGTLAEGVGLSGEEPQLECGQKDEQIELEGRLEVEESLRNPILGDDNEKVQDSFEIYQEQDEIPGSTKSGILAEEVGLAGDKTQLGVESGQRDEQVELGDNKDGGPGEIKVDYSAGLYVKLELRGEEDGSRKDQQKDESEQSPKSGILEEGMGQAGREPHVGGESGQTEELYVYVELTNEKDSGPNEIKAEDLAVLFVNLELQKEEDGFIRVQLGEEDVEGRDQHKSDQRIDLGIIGEGMMSTTDEESQLGVESGQTKELPEDVEHANDNAFGPSETTVEGLSAHFTKLELQKEEDGPRRGQEMEEVVEGNNKVDELFTPLSPTAEKAVDEALACSMRQEILVFHMGSNIEVTKPVIQCLQPGSWLNDEVINVYMELLKERELREPGKFLKCHFSNTFFYNKLFKDSRNYDYQAVARWTSYKRLGYSLLECDKILVPIHQDVHWCLAVIDMRMKQLQYLDSLNGRDIDVLHALAQYLMDEAKAKTGQELDVSKWQHVFVNDIPKQRNGCDCGMFMLKYADFHSRGASLSFTQANMKYFRRRTAWEILQLKAT